MVGLLCGGNQELREDRAGEVEGLFPALWGWRRWLPDGLDSGRGASSLNSQRRCLTAQRGSCDVTITQIWQIRDASEFELEISLLIFFLDSWSRVWQSGSIKKCFSFPLYQYFLSNNPIKMNYWQRSIRMVFRVRDFLSFTIKEKSASFDICNLWTHILDASNTYFIVLWP